MHTQIDLVHLRTWVWQAQSSEDLIRPAHAELLQATLASVYPSAQSLKRGDLLPPLWHWTYFLEGLPPDQLGADGHPARGGFLPPVPLANRMWAGGRIWFEAPLLIGSQAQKRSTVLDVQHKAGKSGELVFVTVQHEVFAGGERCIKEEHDIVYKNPTPPKAPPELAPAVWADAGLQTYTPNNTLLFRYSALTFNGHRIHYDVDYCREVEGYANLVIHGPLNATLMCMSLNDLAIRETGQGIGYFSYRGLAPAVLGQTLGLQTRKTEAGFEAQVLLANGQLAMQACAS